ncbi:MAG: sugar nucleotide-binding protein [Patescibacteria group bacterium]|jgi:dTDP-4-dehydrorhamnose reductase
MKILVLGANGLVGSRFVELNKEKYDFLTPQITEVDITRFDEVTGYFKENRFDTVVNFSAYTDVAAAELQTDKKEEPCWKTNVEGAENLDRICTETSRFLLHISTDAVFSGTADNKGPYKESDRIETNLQNVSWYGFSKARGEEHISSSNAILRISYPYRSYFEGKMDFARTIYELYKTNRLYPLFNDQIITPSFIDEVSDTVSKILSAKLPGIFHCASSNTTTPLQFGNYLIEKITESPRNLKEGSLVEFLLADTTRTKRPIWGGLDTTRTQDALGLRFNTWQESLSTWVRQVRTLS